MGKLAQAAKAGNVLSAAAYNLVDFSGLDDEDRKAIEEDALNGGRVYGVRVVEESVNGGARAPLFGVYKDGPDAERWEKSKKEYGLASTEADDAEVRAGASFLVGDPRREAALREAAAQQAEAEAAAIRAGEEEAVRAITKEDGETPQPAVDRRAASEPTANIVDTTLARNAENEASTAEEQEESHEGHSAPKRKTKTPK